MAGPYRLPKSEAAKELGVELAELERLIRTLQVRACGGGSMVSRSEIARMKQELAPEAPDESRREHP